MPGGNCQFSAHSRDPTLRLVLSLIPPRFLQACHSVKCGVLVAAAVLGGTAAGVMTSVLAGDALAAGRGRRRARLPPCRRAAARRPVSSAPSRAPPRPTARPRAGRTLHPPLLAWFDEVSGGGDRAPMLVGIDGVLVRDASAVNGGDEGVRLLVDVDQVRVGTVWRRAPGRVQIHVAAPRAPVT
jgi:hypothetical protein